MLTSTKGYFLTLSCCIMAFLCHSQHISETNWHQGFIILASGEKIDGEIKADLYREMVRVKTSDGQERAYSPVSVNSFSFTDTERTFLSVATHGKALHGIRFYEVKEEKIEGIVLIKGRRVINPQSNKSMRWRTPTYRVVYDYFFLENGALLAYNKNV